MRIALLLLPSLALVACAPGGRGPETISCSPGVQLQIACGIDGLGSCGGDPILSVCDGAIGSADACVGPSATGFIAENDDALRGSSCPSVTLTCPASGSLAVRPRAYGSTRPYDPTITNCNWATRVPGV